MKAVVLCGGLGTRLRPITYEIPKVLIPVRGKPVLDHLIDLFRREGVTEVILSVGHLKDKIKEYAHTITDIPVTLLEESSPLGTAGPLKLLGQQSEPFIVSNGDELKDIPLKEMLGFHQERQAAATIALKKVENPTLYGVARLDGDVIKEFVEKPLNPPSSLISAGLYILDPTVQQRVPEGFAMLEKDVFPHLAEEGKLFGFPFPGQWYDTGNFERYERAILEWNGIH